MTILAIDGFDVYPNVNSTSYGLQADWLSTGSYTGISLVAGRFGGQGVSVLGAGNTNAHIEYAIAAAGAGFANCCCGFAFMLEVSTRLVDVFALINGGAGGAIQVGMGVNSSQQLVVYQGSIATILAASAQSLSTGSWHFVGYQLDGGVVKVFLDGIQVISVAVAGVATIDAIELGNHNTNGPGGGFPIAAYDDWYCTDGAYLGERRVETLNTASNGTVAWTPLANTNWQEVGETLCDGDTSYVSTATAGTSDFYGINSLSTTPLTIDVVQVRCAVRKDDSSSHILNTQIRSTPSGSAAVLTGAAFAIAGTYLYDRDLHAADPAGNPWAAATVNGAQIGQVLVS